MALQMEKFNINELAGATGLILGAVSGILVVIFKSRCYCKFRVGFSDNCNICMCERKPPPDNVDDSDDESKNKQDVILEKENKILKKEDKILKRTQSEELIPQPEPEIEKLV
jgi:hypothetical protein